MNQLDQLRQTTTVVADTGNFLQLAQFMPRDATPNPSLILKAVQEPDYATLLAQTVAANRSAPLPDIALAVLVRFGCEILNVVPGPPFVGRIHDWQKRQAGVAWEDFAHAGAADAGVQSVRAIYNHYKRHGILTQVMGASFRNTRQILALAGCDLLTISPELLTALQASDVLVPRALSADAAAPLDLPAVHFDERSFRWALNEDAMATERLAEGIRAFAADAVKLDKLIETLAS